MPVATAANLLPSNNVVLSVVAIEPPSYDVAGFEHLSFIQVGKVINIGEFGRQRKTAKMKMIGANAVAKKTGLPDYGEIKIKLALVDNAHDDGQALLSANAATSTKHSIKIEFNGAGNQTTLTYYAVAYVSEFRVLGGAVPNLVQANVNFSITSPVVKGELASALQLIEDLISSSDGVWLQLDAATQVNEIYDQSGEAPSLGDPVGYIAERREAPLA